MTRFAAIALVPVVLLAAGASAQTPPASRTATVSISGCVSPVQRDGSLAPKSGTFATPNTATMEANNPVPTGAFVLLDATPATGPTTSAHTTYALVGRESDVAKFNGSRVAISGSPIAAVSGGAAGSTEAADGIQRIRVATVKKIAGSCSATKK